HHDFEVARIEVGAEEAPQNVQPTLCSVAERLPFRHSSAPARTEPELEAASLHWKCLPIRQNEERARFDGDNVSADVEDPSTEVFTRRFDLHRVRGDTNPETIAPVHEGEFEAAPVLREPRIDRHLRVVRVHSRETEDCGHPCTTIRCRM